jgi:hypothetical protein
MKTVTLPLEFVQEAYKAACNWKKRIEEHVPELAKPKTGWYWWKNNLVYYNNGEETYGFLDGTWSDNLLFSFLLGETPATDKEVETALIAEAKKRGFKEGNYKGLEKLYIDSKFTGWHYGSDLNKLYSAEEGDGGDVIFHNGKWAEKIESPIPKSLQKAIDKLGKEKILELLK